MARPFKGKISLAIRDAVPDWSPVQTDRRHVGQVV